VIPRLNIIAWSANAPWAELRQVEQDLIISRALVDLFREPQLAAELRFRGGTALHKLHFPKPLRYSEDIDLVRSVGGPIGPLIDTVRKILEPWLGAAAIAQTDSTTKLRFRTPAEDDSGDIRLKIEINTRERDAFDPPRTLHYAVDSPWYSGQADISSFSNEELLATKLRALLQRDKGRDLLDLFQSLETFHGLNIPRLVECFGLYLERDGTPIRRAEAERRMLQKLAAPRFLADIRPLLSPDFIDQFNEQEIRRAFLRVFTVIISALPGEPWARTAEMKERFRIDG
jgi:predicted nucleotidyltransferase component of viral defense system